MRLQKLLRPRPADAPPAAGARPGKGPRNAARAGGRDAGAPSSFDTPPEPPPCPPGWHTGPPDFVILGAQKAGTTWWFRLIEAHPGVVQPETQRPELHVFDRLTDTWPTPADIAAYHRFFPRPDGALAGEKTPEYLSSPWAIPMLAQAAPAAKAIVILRDPIDRYLSGRGHGLRGWRKSGKTFEAEPLADRTRLVNGAIAMSRYASQVERVYRHFPREHVLVLQYERCVRDARGEIARTYAFLGLPPHDLPDDELTRLRNVSTGERVSVSDEHIAVLVEELLPDVRRLLDLVPDLDLSLWPRFAAAR